MKKERFGVYHYFLNCLDTSRKLDNPSIRRPFKNFLTRFVPNLFRNQILSDLIFIRNWMKKNNWVYTSFFPKYLDTSHITRPSEYSSSIKET